MRVATRARTQSRRASWGARLVGVGLTTAVAVGFAASPASAAQVPPRLVPGNPTCPAGTVSFKVEPVPSGTSTHQLPGGGEITLFVDTTAAGQQFDFVIEDDVAARHVIAKGGPNANVYTYNAATGFANGITADDDLHAPVNPNTGDYFDLSHIDFCLIPSPYNGNGNGIVNSAAIANDAAITNGRNV